MSHGRRAWSRHDSVVLECRRRWKVRNIGFEDASRCITFGISAGENSGAAIL